MLERYELSTGRIREIITEEKPLNPLISAYFSDVASFICRLADICELKQKNELCKLEFSEMKSLNYELYKDILQGAYDTSYGNPAYLVKAVTEIGLDKLVGQCLCFLYSQVRALIPYSFEADYEMLTIYFEHFIEIYNMFIFAADEESVIDKDALKNTIYWFERDYLDLFSHRKVKNLVDNSESFLTEFVLTSELENERYLYNCGEYVTDNEIKTVKFLNTLSDEQIEAMARTYTEGYRIGFVKAGKPLEKKETVEIRYELGFERVVRAAIRQFEEINLKPVIIRADQLAVNRAKTLNGFFGAVPNRQYLYDHKDDKALFLDGEYVQRKLDLLKSSFEEYKAKAAAYAGPAVIETFGEEPFAPSECKEAIVLNKEQQNLASESIVKNALIVNEYIKGEERSFTIIAYPTPLIGSDFEGIFTETVKLNTLDYKLYETMQQKIIDTLDLADKVRIKGSNGNHTDICINLYKLTDPDNETIFENCVADVNIPVGEVFTSPVLKGTNGVLHVPEVFLNSLKYIDLELTFKDGVITEYTCHNFESEDENKKFIKTNLLNNHDFLPIGEFAIGTNTTAYVMAKKYNINDKLPILIGEKTGPHFAIGDTCYSREEDVKVYNPDGKEIVARSNDYADMRESDPQKAYFSCHTDITIPYDELSFIKAIGKNGEETAIIRDGMFVLDGLDELNKPLKDYYAIEE